MAMLNPAAASFESSSYHYYFSQPPHQHLHGLPLCPPPPASYYASSTFPFSSAYYYPTTTVPTSTPPHHYYSPPTAPPPHFLCNLFAGLRMSPSPVRLPHEVISNRTKEGDQEEEPLHSLQVKAREEPAPVPRDQGQRGRSKSRKADVGRKKRSPSPLFTTRALASGTCKPAVSRGHLLPPSVLEIDMSKRQLGSFTTVMVRNIPNKFSRGMMIQLLDEHCAHMNKTAVADGTVLSEYDFVYLPMDFRNRCNLGYAFVNFTTAEAACRLYGFLNRCHWKVFDSKKVIHVCQARIQGKTALVNHFKHSAFYCDTYDYLPALFSPPRNGTTAFPLPKVIGHLSPLHC